jgi:hypothetical protein
VRSNRFAASNDYFAGAFFTLVPDVAAFEGMLAALAAGGNVTGRYVYGEQDFLVRDRSWLRYSAPRPAFTSPWLFFLARALS